MRDHLLCDSGFKKVAFVRNPYDRLVSAYQDRAQKEGSDLNKKFLVHLARKRLAWSDRSFAEFVRFVVNAVDMKSMDPHIRPQSACLFNGQVKMDFVGRLENLSADLDQLGKILGCELPEIGFQSPVRTAAAEAQSRIYSGDLRDQVFEFYRRDFDLYGYAR